MQKGQLATNNAKIIIIISLITQLTKHNHGWDSIYLCLLLLETISI